MPKRKEAKVKIKQKPIIEKPAKTQEFLGTALTEDDIKLKRFCYETWSANAWYAWDCGVAIGKYLEGLKQGELIGVRCERCNRTLIPPRMFCESCFVPINEFVTLKDTGIVNTFSLCYITWDIKRIKEPQIPAVIEIDGASPGCGILHLISEVNPKDVHIGMRVKAVWKDKNEREGAITDIKYFKPIERG